MRAAEQRRKMRASQSMPIALLGMVCICCLSSSGCGVSEAAEEISRPDLISLAEMALLGDVDRASVQFPHDLHTDVMTERKEDCTLCHVVQDDGYLSATYKPLLDAGEQEAMDLYHESCIGCHQEIADEGATSGPVACGDCHRRRPAYVSSRQPFGFDNSLHYRHVEAARDECKACHHVYDEAAKKLVYAEGKESSCRDCHREETKENRSAFKLAAHQACIGCHREPPAEFKSDPDAPGPQQCAGCHDHERQLVIKRIEDPPRLKRKQPDFVLLSASEADLEFSKLATVPFSHVDHEQVTTSCRTCHHDTLEACGECHTLKGSEKGEGVTLYQSAHETMTDHSCVGCHDTEKAATECVGCHGRMEEGKLSEEACGACHAGPLPEKLESERGLWTSLENFRPSPSETVLSFAPEDVPETVEIGALANEYQVAKMPHRKIVEKLSQYIKDSSVASYFHGHEDVVCQGCHHGSPVGKKPPLCESCHGTSAADSDLHKPGLLGAYHRQCLGCHQSMELEKPSDCSGCHAEKEGTIETAASGGFR
ncbi:MAG: cytochrome C [Deltaproteobacteria bacterium]|nr:cytochrome C [Deltaproteobacteria bacterium]